MMRWFHNRLNLVEPEIEASRPSAHDDFETAIRVEEAIAAASAGSKIVQNHLDEAQRLLGVIRREVKNTRPPGKAHA